MKNMDISKKYLAIILSSAAFVGCSSSGGDDASVTAQSLTASDFSFSASDSLSQSDFIETLNSDPSFFYDDPFSILDTSGDSSCIEASAASRAVITDLGEGEYEFSIPALSVLSCIDPIAGVSIDSFNISLFASGKIVDNLNMPVVGLPSEDVFDILYNDNIPGFNVAEAEIAFVGSGSLSVNTGLQIVTGSYEYKSLLTGLNPDSRCEFNFLVSEIDNCTQWGSFFITADGVDVLATSQLILNGVNYTEGSSYFRDGDIQFRFNDWIGTMTYGADPTVAPSYSATQVSSGASVSGTFSYIP